MGKVGRREARETAHEVRSMAPALLAGNAAVHGGRPSLAVTVRAWPPVALAGRPGLGLGDGLRRPRPVGVAAVGLGAAARQRGGAPRAGRSGRAFHRWYAVERDAWAEVLAIAD